MKKWTFNNERCARCQKEIGVLTYGRMFRGSLVSICASCNELADDAADALKQAAGWTRMALALQRDFEQH